MRKYKAIAIMLIVAGFFYIVPIALASPQASLYIDGSDPNTSHICSSIPAGTGKTVNFYASYDGISNINYAGSLYGGANDNSGQSCFYPASFINTQDVINQLGNGTFYLVSSTAAGGSQPTEWWGSFTISGGIIGLPVIPNGTTTTRFITVEPDATTTATTTVLLIQTGYINSVDFASTTAVSIELKSPGCLSTAPSVYDSVNDRCSIVFTSYPTSSGAFSFSTTTTFAQIGRYNFIASIDNTVGAYCIFGYCLSTTGTTSAIRQGSFIVGTSSAYDVLQSYIASSTASNVATDLSSCSLWGGSGDVVTCVAVLLLPSSAQWSDFVSGLSGQFLTYFPVGYITRIVTILNSSSSSPIPVVSATIPTGVAGAGSSISLNLNHSLDYILYATTSSFTNSSASSTKSLYEITSYYWDRLVYIALAVYIFGRILGSHLVPHIGFYTNSETGRRRIGRYNPRTDNLFDD